MRRRSGQEDAGERAGHGSLEDVGDEGFVRCRPGYCCPLRAPSSSTMPLNLWDAKQGRAGGGGVQGRSALEGISQWVEAGAVGEKNAEPKRDVF